MKGASAQNETLEFMMPYATVAKDATTDLDPSEFRNVGAFATVACGTYASAAAVGFAQ